MVVERYAVREEGGQRKRCVQGNRGGIKAVVFAGHGPRLR
jgi:hypothetical protein